MKSPALSDIVETTDLGAAVRRFSEAEREAE
jgi:hypothetical protein